MRRLSKISFVVVVFSVVLIAIFWLWSSRGLNEAGQGNSADSPQEVGESLKAGWDDLTFSNTMAWEPKLLEIANRETKYVKEWQEVFVFPNPPENLSERTQRELELLLDYKQMRTPDKIQQIRDEADLNAAQKSRMGGLLIADYFDGLKYPNTAILTRISFSDLNVVILSTKKMFNRVRPHILEPDLAPVIEVPGHPAYPSGHSTQAHFLSFLLSEIIPEKAELLMEDAARIAKNREIAGLHYPSDTDAGKVLARQFMDFLLQDPYFQELISLAREEWR